MPAQEEAVSGLWFNWNSGESGMKQQMDENWLKIGTLLQLRVVSRALTAAPATPDDGACYIPAAGATGVAWGGMDGKIAVWREYLNAWEFYDPQDGWVAVVLNEGTWGTQTVFKTGAWSPGTALG